jgi:hypothetical protein
MELARTMPSAKTAKKALPNLDSGFHEGTFQKRNPIVGKAATGTRAFA